MKNTATFMCSATNGYAPPANGIAMNAANDAQKLTYGASLNRNSSAPSGIKSSLVSSLMPSASVCSQPNWPPTRVGPEPILNAARNLALHPDEQQRADRHQIHQQEDLDQRGQRVCQPGPDSFRDEKLGHVRSVLHQTREPRKNPQQSPRQHPQPATQLLIPEHVGPRCKIVKYRTSGAGCIGLTTAFLSAR